MTRQTFETYVNECFRNGYTRPVRVPRKNRFIPLAIILWAAKHRLLKVILDKQHRLQDRLWDRRIKLQARTSSTRHRPWIRELLDHDYRPLSTITVNHEIKEFAKEFLKFPIHCKQIEGQRVRVTCWCVQDLVMLLLAFPRLKSDRDEF